MSLKNRERSVARLSTQRFWPWVLTIVLLGVVTWSMAGSREESPLVGDMKNGKRLYQIHCAVCHGFDGSGSGPGRIALKIPPADHRDGALMNALDNLMIYRFIESGCRGGLCKGAMPAFQDSLSQLDIWDVISFLRTLHVPLRAIFPEVDHYVFKSYSFGKEGNQDFRQGQLDRIRKVVKDLDPQDLSQTVFTLFRSSSEQAVFPKLISQDPRQLAQLKKKNKIGYVVFLKIKDLKGDVIPIVIGLDLNYSIIKLLTTLSKPESQGVIDNQLAKYVGLGKRGQLPEFKLNKDPQGKAIDKEINRAYIVAVEAANAYELEERERSWADDTFK